MKSALQSYLIAKADRGYWRRYENSRKALNFSGIFIFFYLEARGSDDICMAIVDRGASGWVSPADVERFFAEMVKNATTCASQS